MTDENLKEGSHLSISIRKQSVFGMLLLTLFSLGIYVPLWYLKFERNIDSDNQQSKNRKLLIWLLLILCICTAILEISFEVSEQLAGLIWLKETTEVLNNISTIIAVSLVFMCRAILNEYYNVQQKMGIKFSILWTLFLSIFYLQYKMNQIALNEVSDEPLENKKERNGNLNSSDTDGILGKMTRIGICPYCSHEVNMDTMEIRCDNCKKKMKINQKQRQLLLVKSVLPAVLLLNAATGYLYMTYRDKNIFIAINIFGIILIVIYALRMQKSANVLEVIEE